MGEGNHWSPQPEIFVRGQDDEQAWLEEIARMVREEGCELVGVAIQAGSFHIQRMLRYGRGVIVAYLDEPARGRFPGSGLSLPSSTWRASTPLAAAEAYLREQEAQGKKDLQIIDAGDFGFPMHNGLVAVCTGPDDPDSTFFRAEPAQMPQ